MQAFAARLDFLWHAVTANVSTDTYPSVCGRPAAWTFPVHSGELSACSPLWDQYHALYPAVAVSYNQSQACMQTWENFPAQSLSQHRISKVVLIYQLMSDVVSACNVFKALILLCTIGLFFIADILACHSRNSTGVCHVPVTLWARTLKLIIILLFICVLFLLVHVKMFLNYYA